MQLLRIIIINHIAHDCLFRQKVSEHAICQVARGMYRDTFMSNYHPRNHAYKEANHVMHSLHYQGPQIGSKHAHVPFSDL